MEMGGLFLLIGMIGQNCSDQFVYMEKVCKNMTM